MRAPAWGVLALVAAAACAPPDPAPSRPGDEAGAVGQPTAAPDRFGFGVPAGEARIAAWDRDVGPDGEGLPPGSGTPTEGGRVYLENCLACHGPTGVEGPYDVLVGGEPWGEGEAPRVRTIGNYWPWATTLYDYIGRAMPQHAPGSLTPDETYAVIAWLLWRNGVVAGDAVMDARTLPEVVMPGRVRFVPDDRRGGAEVR